MRWSQKFEAGLPELDAQHRQIFSLILRLNAMVEEEDRTPVIQFFVDLETLTRCHFDCEEWLIRNFNYPQSSNHSSDHYKLVHEIRGYRGSAVFNLQKLALVLSNWLISHTMQDDRPLVEHILLNHSGGLAKIAHAPSFEVFSETARRLAVVDFGNELEESL